MRKLHISSIKSGDILAKPVWGANGSFLLGAGVPLNERYIEKLRSFEIDFIFVDDEYTSDIIPEDSIKDGTRKKAVETVYKTMIDLKATPAIKQKVAHAGMGQAYQQVIGDILGDLAGKKDLMFSLANLHSKDGYLFHHAVNVAVLAGIIGIAKGYNRTQLTELGMGALLCDIGMTRFPEDFWQIDSTLTSVQREQIQRHAEEGFDILRKQYDISLLSAHCALQHHERYDGTGYPRGLKGNEIHEYAQIVAIADVYSALTAPRSYRRAYSPSEAIEFLYANGNIWFDVELIKIFVSHIAVYPVATTVLLNTGQVGVVAAVDPKATHRPIIRIIRERDGTPPTQAYEINLSKELNLTITKEL